MIKLDSITDNDLKIKITVSKHEEEINDKSNDKIKSQDELSPMKYYSKSND